MSDKPRNPKAVPDGIDLRDWFAGLAMQTLIAKDHCQHAEVASRNAYWYADAMLAERERNHD